MAFQIEEVKGKNLIIPPMATPEQSLPDLLEVAYYNMMIFLQDFIALLLLPHISEYFAPSSFPSEEVTESIAPKWLVMIKKLKQFGLGSLRGNPAFLMQYFSTDPPPMPDIDCPQMMMHYTGFLKQD